MDVETKNELRLLLAHLKNDIFNYGEDTTIETPDEIVDSFEEILLELFAIRVK